MPEVVLSPAASFMLPADFISTDTPFSKIEGLVQPRFLYNVGDSLLCIAISDILKNHQQPEVFNYDNLKEGKDFTFQRTPIEKSDMRMVDPASYFLQKRYPDVEWTTAELRKGVQSLVYHGGQVVVDLMGNPSTAQRKLSELIHFGLPVPEVPEEEAEGVAEGEIPQDVAIEAEAGAGEDGQ